MKRKTVIAAAVLWLACVVGGAIWGRVEQQMSTHNLSPEQLEVNKLRDLYGARLFREALTECDAAYRDPIYVEIRPQVLYVEWLAQSQLGGTEAASQVRREFLERYPSHPLAANMHFANATEFLGVANYSAAQREFELAAGQYPQLPVARKANEILVKVRRVTSTTAPVD